MVSGVAIVLDVRVRGSRDPGQRGRPALSHSVFRCRHGPRWPLARRRAPHLFHIQLGYQLSPSPLTSAPVLMRRRERVLPKKKKMATGSSLNSKLNRLPLDLWWCWYSNYLCHSRESRIRHGCQQRVRYPRQQRPPQMPIPVLHGRPSPSWIVDDWRRNCCHPIRTLWYLFLFKRNSFTLSHPDPTH